MDKFMGILTRVEISAPGFSETVRSELYIKFGFAGLQR